MDFRSNEADRIAQKFQCGARLRIEFPNAHTPFSRCRRASRGSRSFEMDYARSAAAASTANPVGVFVLRSLAFHATSKPATPFSATTPAARTFPQHNGAVAS
jgi:hypothetical protein